ncbi:MAG TPA: O-methyltransferase [Planctomycetota bacterium]|nr:O-methyltransferase [Planctomycetota bacterium]
MSEEPTRVTEAHFRYVAQRTTQEDGFLLDLRISAAKAGIPAISIGPAQAAFLQILLRATRARHVIEIGTLAGYSAIAMARALPPDGRVLTIEIDPKHAAFASEWIAKSDVAGKVAVHLGAGKDVLRKIPDRSADACFLDADKGSYRHYLDECLRILKPGGLMMADNAFAFGQLLDEDPTDRDVPAVRAFNDYVPTVAGLQSVIVPLGDGLWVGVKT